MTRSTIRFRAKVSRTGAWSFLTLPKSASAKLLLQEETMVEGTINSFPFRAVCEANGNGSPRLMLSKALRTAAGADSLDSATVEITRVGEEPETRVPADLSRALKAAPPARASWAEITPTARRDWILWISTAKQPKTRQSRIQTACDMLSSGKRRVCCFPGLNWLTKDHVASSETWLPLPKSKKR
jgi:hypothetical protein